ncbi:MAG: hypothetical protein EON54_27765, partial [Alcaligenaceae bacterium]
MRTGDAETGITKIFDPQQAQKNLDAQVKITQSFTKEAPKAVGTYADNQAKLLRSQISTATVPVERERLETEARKWDETGRYRVSLHTFTGALVGGLGGALGAVASASAAEYANEFQAGIEATLQAAGMSHEQARFAAQGVITVALAGVGAVLGGAPGAASASTVDFNNRQLHETDRQIAKRLAKIGPYSQEQIEEQMRLMGNAIFKEDPNQTAVLIGSDAIGNNLLQDPYMPKAVGPASISEIAGNPDAEIQAYIIANTKTGASYIPGVSPYIGSNSALFAPKSGIPPQ